MRIFLSFHFFVHVLWSRHIYLWFKIMWHKMRNIECVLGCFKRFDVGCIGTGTLTLPVCLTLTHGESCGCNTHRNLTKSVCVCVRNAGSRCLPRPDCRQWMSLSALSAYQCRRGEPTEEARYSLQTGERRGMEQSIIIRGVLAAAKRITEVEVTLRNIS